MRTAPQIRNAFVTPKPPTSENEGIDHAIPEYWSHILNYCLDTNILDMSMPGAFPSTPPESPGLKPIDPYDTITEKPEPAFQGWDIDARTQPALVTDLGTHLHPRWPSQPYRPPTPKPSPPPSLPLVEPVQDDLMEIDDPWERYAQEFAKSTHGPVSAVRLFNPKPQPIPSNRVASWYAPEFERREQDRIARELEGQRPSRVIPPGEPVRLLSPAWLTKVSNAAQSTHGQVITRSISGDEIYQHDILTCVRPLAWLNDEIINSYLQLITRYLRQLKQNLGPSDRPLFHSFNTFFFSKLHKEGYEGVQRWAKRAKIGGEQLLSVDTVFIPVHEINHWTLMVLRPVDRTIEYFDSLGSDGAFQVKWIKKWLHGELGSKYKDDEWSVLGSVSSRQDNGSDCGVFLLTNAKAIALGIEPTAFGPSHTKLLRRKIVAELMNGGLHGEFMPQDSTGTLLL